MLVILFYAYANNNSNNYDAEDDLKSNALSFTRNVDFFLIIVSKLKNTQPIHN